MTVAFTDAPTIGNIGRLPTAADGLMEWYPGHVPSAAPAQVQVVQVGHHDESVNTLTAASCSTDVLPLPTGLPEGVPEVPELPNLPDVPDTDPHAPRPKTRQPRPTSFITSVRPTSNPTTLPTSFNPGSSPHPLNGGEVFGIVFGVLVIIRLLVGIYWRFKKHDNKTTSDSDS